MRIEFLLSSLCSLALAVAACSGDDADGKPGGAACSSGSECASGECAEQACTTPTTTPGKQTTCKAPWDCPGAMACERFDDTYYCVDIGSKSCTDDADCGSGSRVRCLGVSSVNNSPTGHCVERQYAGPNPCKKMSDCAVGYRCLSEAFSGYSLCFRPR